MTVNRHLLLLATALLMTVLATAQNPSTSNTEGIQFGNYQVQQSMEFGERLTGINGNSSMYDSLVNLHQGPRLLDQTLSMRSLTHAGTFFDDLYVSSFGYGGDPNDATRLRISKDRWYDFAATYRRDNNYFDYNLLANPVNAPNQFIISDISPHSMDTRRHMGDFNLTLFPQSKLRFRLGYSRMLNDGDASSSFHEGTEISLAESFRSRADRYEFGVDFQPLARTMITFNQFYEHDKNDTNWTDTNFNRFVLANGAAVDPGIVYDTVTGVPCATAITAPNVLRTSCNGYLGYNRFSPSRTDIPTSQLSVVSNYFRRLELSASGSYTSASSDMTSYDENARTFVSRTNEIGFQYSGPARAEQIQGNADLGATYQLASKWSLSDKWRWVNWRVPGNWDSTAINCFPNVATGAGLLSTPGVVPGTSTVCAALTGLTPTGLAYNPGTDPNIGVDNYARFFGERSIYNTLTLNWDPSQRLSAYLGYRYGDRHIEDKDFDSTDDTYYTVKNGAYVVKNQPTAPAGSVDETNIHQHSALAGIVVRPVDAWRVNADAELMTADNSFTDMSPRHKQQVKVRSSYRIAQWGTVSGSLNLLERRNNDYVPFPTGINIPESKDHVRSYNLAFSLQPTRRIGFDLGWDYQNVLADAGTCMPFSVGRAGTTVFQVVPQGGPLAACTTGTGILPVVLDYQERANSGYAMVSLRPTARILVNLGYDITSNSGENDWVRADTLAPLLLPANAAGQVLIPTSANYTSAQYVEGPNPNVPLGPLALNWHKPVGSIAISLSKAVTFKGGYGYYGYNEKGTSGPVTPRDFHANTGTMALRYEF